MYKRIIAFFIIIFFSFLKANAETFIVINNNDNGSGSFREALLKAAANGNGEIDYVHFNIPSTTIKDRTILLLTDLPEITSDIIIDASTQPGSNISVNGGKIIFDGTNFKYTSSIIIQSFLMVSKVNVFEIYGIVARNFYTQNAFGTVGISSIYFKGQINNVKIGAVNKGNVFYNMFGIGGNFSDVNNKSSLPNFSLKNTYLGIQEDGITIADKVNCSSQIYRLSNTIIGGDTKEEGNIIYGDFGSFVELPGSLMNRPFNLDIKNNIFYANKNEERPGINGNSGNRSIGFSIDANLNHPYTSKIVVSDNIFGIGFSLGGFDNADILITRNSFGVSADKTKVLPIFTQALTLNNINGKVLIGGTKIEDVNVFSNTNNYKNYEWLYPGAVWSQKSYNVELSHNSFFCNPRMPYLIADTGPYTKPIDIFLDNVTFNTVSGRSKPGSRIELYYSDPECTNCQPKRFFGTATTDANGNWLYSGTLENGYAILAGATLNGISSEFSDPRIYLTNTGQTFKITNQTCEVPNGKIEGVYLVNVNHFEWLDEAGNVVGTDKDLINVKAGNYRLKAYQFGCIIYSDWATIGDNTPQLSLPGTPSLIHPSCGNLGSILDLFPNYFKDLSWLDENGNVVGKNRELKDVPSGSYTLHLVGLTDCNANFGPYILKNSLGPSADFSKTKLTNTLCTSKTGSITGIITSGTGKLMYKWMNENDIVVGSNLDLLNVGAGKYTLEIKDESACKTISSQSYEIIEIDGVSMDESLAKSYPTLCNKNSGAVRGISVQGATSFVWTDSNGSIVSQSKDLENIGVGTYILKAKSSSGCVVISKAFNVDYPAPTEYPLYDLKIIDTSCGFSNGSGSIFSKNYDLPKFVRWVNDEGVLVSNEFSVQNLKAGNYKIFFTDQNGCEILYKMVTINEIPLMKLNDATIVIMPDECGQKIGTISNINISGGLPPYNFTWANSKNQIISTSANVRNLYFGSYNLTVKDQLNCQIIKKEFEVSNRSEALTQPEISPISICATTIVNIAVNNSQMGLYKLYNSTESIQPIATSNNGKFQIEVSGDSKLYMSYSIGECESLKSKILIEMNGAELNIPVSFSPNGDNINDVWHIKNLNNYSQAVVRIYNRMGSKIFENIGSELAFDGTYKGVKLPLGVYYYTILLSNNCKQISGSLTILY